MKPCCGRQCFSAGISRQYLLPMPSSRRKFEEPAFQPAIDPNSKVHALKAYMTTLIPYKHRSNPALCTKILDCGYISSMSYLLSSLTHGTTQMVSVLCCALLLRKPASSLQAIAARRRPINLPAYEVLYKIAEETEHKRWEKKKLLEMAELEVSQSFGDVVSPHSSRELPSTPPWPTTNFSWLKFCLLVLQ